MDESVEEAVETSGLAELHAKFESERAGLPRDCGIVYAP
jgi:hypothetical protein